MIDDVRAEGQPVLILDGGNLLARNGRVTDAAREGMQMKADLLLRYAAREQIDAMNVGGGDLVFGVDWLKTQATELELPYVSANLTDADGEPLFPAYRVREIDGLKVGVLGLSGELRGNDEVQVTDAIAAATAAVTTLQEQGCHLVIALSQQTFEQDVALVEAVAGIDFLFSGATARRGQVPGLAGETPTYLVRSTGRGREIGRMDLTFVEGGRGFFDEGLVSKARSQREKSESRMATLEQQLADATTDRERSRRQRSLDRAREELDTLGVADLTADGRHAMTISSIGLGKKIADHPEVAKMVEETSAQLPDQGKHGAKRERPKIGEFVGASGCRSCHQGIYRHWRGTQHARSYTTLAREKRQTDESCFGCHITGFHLEGGPRTTAEVSYLRNVQCEACHGPSAKHAADPAVHTPMHGKVADTCTACHNETAHGGDTKPFVLADATEAIRCKDAPLPEGQTGLRLAPLEAQSPHPPANAR